MTFPEDKIESLVMGFLERRLSDEELHEFTEWLESDPSNADYFYSVKSVYGLCRHEDVQVEESWRRLSVKIAEQRDLRKRGIRRIVLSIAAGFLLVLSAGISFIALSDLNLIPEREPQVFVYSTQRSTAFVELPDGTSVHLGPNTDFRYASDYGKSERRVYLDGEGYFEVAKDKRRRFIVVSHEQEIVVTGTKFNVRSYSEDRESVTTLLEGSITFHSSAMNKSISLQPKEQIRYNDEKQTLSVKYLPDAANEILWLDSRYVFENDSLSDILDRMQNLYQVKFVCNNKKAMNTTYKVTFYQDESLDDFLRIIKKMSDLSSVERGDTVYLR